MPFEINPRDLIEATIEQELFGQTVINVLHFWCNDTFLDTMSDVFFPALENEFTQPGDLIDLMKKCQSKDLKHKRILFQKIKPQRYARQPFPTGGEGEYDDSTVSANVAAVLTKRTDRAREANNPDVGQVGSFHLGGVPNNEMEAGTLATTYVTDKLEDVGAWMVADFVAPVLQGLEHVLWHRNAPGPTSTNKVTDIEPQRTVRVMRRRTVGVGI